MTTSQYRQCTVPDCLRPHAAKDLCARHYALNALYGDPEFSARKPTPLCKVDGCDEKHDAKGYCAKHYMAWKRYGDPLTKRRATPTTEAAAAAAEAAPCRVDGCDRKPYGRGLCNMHWQRWRKTGDPVATLRDMRAAEPLLRCKVEGCDRPHKANGYCGMHNTRVKTWGYPGSPDPIRSRVEGVCRIDSCNRPATNGREQLCTVHYKRLIRYGDPLAGGRYRVPGQRCEIDECDRKHYSLGFCKNHYGSLIDRPRHADAPGASSSEQVRARIGFYGGRCWMCGEVADTIDHVIPLARGGSNHPANLRPACLSCNSAKKDRDVWEFIPRASVEGN